MEQKITCPICFSEDKCFEDVQEQDGKSFSSYICFKCGFTSNSTYKWDSNELKQAQLGATQLMNDVSHYDEDREVMWFPSVLNMGKLGMIYPEGTKGNWNYKKFFKLIKGKYEGNFILQTARSQKKRHVEEIIINKKFFENEYK